MYVEKKSKQMTTWLRKTAVKLMPNFVGIMDNPLLVQRLVLHHNNSNTTYTTLTTPFLKIIHLNKAFKQFCLSYNKRFCGHSLVILLHLGFQLVKVWDSHALFPAAIYSKLVQALVKGGIVSLLIHINLPYLQVQRDAFKTWVAGIYCKLQYWHCRIKMVYLQKWCTCKFIAMHIKSFQYKANLPFFKWL